MMSDLDVHRLKDFGFEPTQMKAFLGQLIAVLLPDFESLERKIALKDWEQAKDLAHSFKGMISIFATAQLARELQILEDELKTLSKNPGQSLQTDMDLLKVRLKELHCSALNYQDQL